MACRIWIILHDLGSSRGSLTSIISVRNLRSQIQAQMDALLQAPVYRKDSKVRLRPWHVAILYQQYFNHTNSFKACLFFLPIVHYQHLASSPQNIEKSSSKAISTLVVKLHKIELTDRLPAIFLSGVIFQLSGCQPFFRITLFRVS